MCSFLCFPTTQICITAWKAGIRRIYYEEEGSKEEGSRRQASAFNSPLIQKKKEGEEQSQH
jgi:hypothetical protein